MIRKLGDLASAALLLALLAVVGLANLAGRAVWMLSRWPGRGRTP